MKENPLHLETDALGVGLVAELQQVKTICVSHEMKYIQHSITPDSFHEQDPSQHII